MLTCFWACLVELSPRNRSRTKCPRKAGTACCRTPGQHRAAAFHHTRSPCSSPRPCLPCNQKHHPTGVSLKKQRFQRGSQVPVHWDTSQTPENLHTSQFAPLCPHEGLLHTKHTLLSGKTQSAHSTSTSVWDSWVTHHSTACLCNPKSW